jgi:glycosyltransferase involved in cell wall biosynthesis
MRIVIVNKFAHVTGGADRHCLDLASLLRAEGHEVALLSTKDERNEEVEGRFVEASVTNATRDRLRGLGRSDAARRALWNPAAADAVTDLVNEFRPDILHCHKLYPQLSVAPVVLARRHGIPVIQTIHDYEFVSASPLDASGSAVDREESSAAFRTLNTATFAIRRRVHRPRVSTWIAVSDAVAAIYRLHGIDPVVIRNFVMRDGTEPTPHDEREGVVYVGRLTHEKGSDAIVELARLLPDVHVIAAGMGPDTARIAAAASELPNLSFVGRLSSEGVERLLRSALVALMPSRWREPGPLAALEAMRAGTPIVAFDSGGLAEYVRLADAGIVVEHTAAALADGCRTLLENPTAWQRASDGGRAGVAEVFSAERHVHEIVEVYEGAVAARQGRAV